MLIESYPARSLEVVGIKKTFDRVEKYIKGNIGSKPIETTTQSQKQSIAVQRQLYKNVTYTANLKNDRIQLVDMIQDIDNLIKQLVSQKISLQMQSFQNAGYSAGTEKSNGLGRTIDINS